MADSINFIKHDDYLLAKISDTVITSENARLILTRIGLAASRLNCNKVLLDEMSVERREIQSYEIMQLSQGIKKIVHNKLYIAFLCQPHLINHDTKLLSLFTFGPEFKINYFSDKEAAINWLKEP